uniref:Retrovirus-related Pol polyprotein from transposon TNT 1-94 n=1 Tax=Cajanus cajan TaxID=3821 RepID=A0A151R1J4_CAJCA|nr:Retrovirus-related Pol polyprotein from transposon TNT 1-94 [Cajanus cajan]
MASGSNSLPPPPVFAGENYDLWAAKMRTYLRAQSLWEVVENGRNPAPLPDNPTMAQVRFHSDEVAKEGRALAIIQAAVHDDVFIKILNLDTAKEAWDKLKEEFQGSERIRRMKVLNLIREFEAIKMKEAETVKEFADRLSKVVTQIRLLGEELSDQQVVEKILVCLPERFESKISSLEENKDFSHISISELVNALQATKHRRSLRMEENVEGVFVVNTKEESNRGGGWKDKYPPCSYCKKKNDTENFCWFRPGVKCRACNQLGHVEKVCKSKAKQQGQQAQVVEHEEQNKEHLFVASCYLANRSKEEWLIDSGCTNHMTNDASIFKELDHSHFSKVTIGNEESVEVKGKGVIAVETSSGTKYISDVL